MRTDDNFPDTSLIYYLMFRGSVTPKTMKHCIETVRKGIPVSDLERFKEAENLIDHLWDGFADSSLTSRQDSV